jgi:hypothetical protein
MNRTIFAKSVARRTVLAGVGAGVIGSLLRPLQAQEAMGSPRRLLIVHRPCGTILNRFFPATGSAKDFTFPDITKAFEPLKNDMVLVNGIDCPRDHGWPADQHAAALIAMMGGRKFVQIPGTNAAGDPNAKNIVAPGMTIDQHLVSKVKDLQAAVPSIQSTAYLPSTGGLPSFKVMSYKGPSQALFPEYDAAALFKRLFIGENAGLTPEEIARKVDQSKSVLDRVHADLTRLQGLIPSSQKPKLDSHLAALQGLEASLNGSTGMPGGKECTPPMQSPLGTPSNGATVDEANHLALAQNHLAIIQTAFQCDITRVATFSFAHGNSDLRFNKIVSGFSDTGVHHGISHEQGADDFKARIDQIYCEQLAAFLLKMKAVPDGNGNLLDNTLVVFFNECADGNGHTIENMPVAMFGGKNVGLQTGQHLNFRQNNSNGWMNDIWAAVCGVYGAEAKFGDDAFFKGPVSGLFA